MTASTTSPTRHPRFTRTLPRAAESAKAARGLICAALAAWAIDDLAEDAALVVSELVGNAVEHTACHLIKVTVTRTSPETVRVAVVDKSRTTPARRTPGDDEVGGRGLLVVDALTTRWGTDPLNFGKRVWGDLTRQPAG
ncbi:ATP-binding protein [Streptomyces sp. WMMC500]|uniref:ATP-binding protein n=1 Tax=Streptomyces sp. WMMC500 TaxID=3015154 RepID=UPI00248A9859|nr:ATP-binding protein [Streptomyces sp. WMMC500]WBB64288.1 ATP-binding protein [Streptomyces sp. WMMC500]